MSRAGAGTWKSIPGIKCFAGEGQLGEFLARTDVLVCLLPLTPQTRGILNRRTFSRLARDGKLGGPVIINAGRGGLQNEDDLLARSTMARCWRRRSMCFTPSRCRPTARSGRTRR
jgi:phosphoglycerate dehydrogenase-like enzyme